MLGGGLRGLAGLAKRPVAMTQEEVRRSLEVGGSGEERAGGETEEGREEG